MTGLFESEFWAEEESASGLGMGGNRAAILLISVDEHVKLKVETQRKSLQCNFLGRLLYNLIPATLTAYGSLTVCQCFWQNTPNNYC